jgi:hypothetical protein
VLIAANGATLHYDEKAELAVCPQLSHDGPIPERVSVLAGLIRDFARRHTSM